MRLKDINKMLGTKYQTFKEFKDNVDWDNIDWDNISKYQKLSEEFIKEFKDKVYWYNISIYQKLSENFIKEFKDDVNWDSISIYQKLSENFIKEFKDNVYWDCISQYQKLSENFIKEFKDDVDWFYISAYQKLSENFIKEFKDDVDWFYISQYQKLSEDFIKEFKDDVNWNYISQYQKLSKEFIKEYDIKLDNDSWLYKSDDFKKKKVIECNLYECFDDYFIAYKAIRNDRYSFFNFQYKYCSGNIYESHCDYSNNENSFGLSVWTENKAKEYNSSGIIIKVKVKYSDIGRLIHNNGKIRCSKIEILN